MSGACNISQPSNVELTPQNKIVDEVIISSFFGSMI